MKLFLMKRAFVLNWINSVYSLIVMLDINYAVFIFEILLLLMWIYPLFNFHIAEITINFKPTKQTQIIYGVGCHETVYVPIST